MIDDATRDRAIEGVDELLSLFVEGWMSPGTSKNVVDAVLSWVQPELDKARDENLRLEQKLSRLRAECLRSQRQVVDLGMHEVAASMSCTLILNYLSDTP